MSDVDMETVSWLIASEHRLETCRTLADSMATPTGIAEETDIASTHVSRSLSALQERGVVELLCGEDQRKGRIYALTDTGAKTFEKATQVKR